MKIEFNFFKKKLDLSAGVVQKRIIKRLTDLNFPIDWKVDSVTLMSKWFCPILEFPNNDWVDREVEILLDAIAGVIIDEFKEYLPRYRHYEIHGKTRSLVYHQEWEKEKYE